MNKKFTQLYLSAFLCFYASTVCAQITPSIPEWKNSISLPELKIDYRYQTCFNVNKGMKEEFVYLQLQNLSNKKILVTWEEELWLGEECFNCEGNNPEFTKKLVLNPLETLKGECVETDPLEKAVTRNPLRIFSRFIDVPGASGRSLTKFSFKNIKIEIIN